MVDNNGVERLHRAFDSYGNILSEIHFDGERETVTKLDPGYLDEAFAYTGRLLDKDTGLQNNLNRWYDASIGRWMSEDPIGLGPDTNPYRYVGNSPLNGSDPSGTIYVDPGWPEGNEVNYGPPLDFGPPYPPRPGESVPDPRRMGQEYNEYNYECYMDTNDFADIRRYFKEKAEQNEMQQLIERIKLGLPPGVGSQYPVRETWPLGPKCTVEIKEKSPLGKPGISVEIKPQ